MSNVNVVLRLSRPLFFLCQLAPPLEMESEDFHENNLEMELPVRKYCRESASPAINARHTANNPGLLKQVASQCCNHLPLCSCATTGSFLALLKQLVPLHCHHMVAFLSSQALVTSFRVDALSASPMPVRVGAQQTSTVYVGDNHKMGAAY